MTVSTVMSLQRNNDADDFLVRTFEGATAELLEEKWVEIATEIDALNADIPGNPDKWSLADVNMAGAGDGHRFVVTVTFVRQAFNVIMNVILGVAGGVTVAVAAVPAAVSNGVMYFGLSGSHDGLQQKQLDTIRRGLAQCAVLSPGTGERALVQWQYTAGASQGTRFMYGLRLVPGQYPLP